MTAAAMRVGWCPGALRPMAAGDGLILRVKPRGATLTLTQTATIAALAGRYGSGDIDLTGRANLQIRGVSEDTLEPLTHGLHDARLLDSTPEAEAVRNLVSSPLAGLEASALGDIRPIVTALEARLTTDPELYRLPAKWGMVLDDGGRFPLRDIQADVRFEAMRGGFHVGLANDPVRSFCTAADLVEVAVALCRQALVPQPMRMAEAMAVWGAPAILTAAGLACIPAVDIEKLRTPRPAPIGLHRLARGSVLGIGALFGSLRAEDLSAVVASAGSLGASDVRLTPWRALLITGLDPSSAAALADAARQQGFIVDPDDPRLTIAACTGAPACHRATTPVRQHAAALTSGQAPGRGSIQIHVSGCAKGCAHSAPAPWTLVGRDGLYDLVRDGRPGDTPLAQSLSFQDAASWLSRTRNLGLP